MDQEQSEEKGYGIGNWPDDVLIFTQPPIVYEPIDPSETYTVEVTKADLIDNRYYKPDEKDPIKRGNKYQISFEFRVLDEGRFYGRKLWDYANLVFKPNGKKGASKLYKIITNVMKVDFDWEGCASFAPNIDKFMQNITKEVLNKQVKVAIENITNPENQKVRSKITTYNRIKKELPKFDMVKIGVGSQNVDPDELGF